VVFRDDRDAQRARIEALESKVAELEQEKQAAAEAAKPEPAPAAPSEASRPGRPFAHRKLNRPVTLARRIAVAVVLLGFALIVLWDFGAFWRFGDVPAPSSGTIDLDRTPAPDSVLGFARGGMFGPLGCGFYHLQDAPFVRVHLSRPTRVRFVVLTEPEDLLLVLRTAGGTTLCESGIEPRILADLPPGDHSVWVGNRNEDVTSRFHLSIAAVSR
jgi:hypothetical protein